MSRRKGRIGSTSAAGLLRALVAVAGLLAACSHAASVPAPGPPPSTVLGRDEPGPDPFVAAQGPATAVDPAVAQLALAAVAAADAAEAAAGADPAASGTSGDGDGVRTIQRARLKAATDVFTTGHLATVRPRSVLGVGILPGDPGPVCGVEGLLTSLAQSSEATAALAAVAGIDPGDVPRYLRSLRAGYLVDVAPVILHGRRRGRTTATHAVLAAGTAVLVDDLGLPRLRCRSADPLQPTRVELDGAIVDSAVFADRVIAASIGPDVAAADVVSVDGRFTNRPERALGPPDKVAVSLGEQPPAALRSARQDDGCQSSLTLAFDDNRLVDGPGDDLRIVELGLFESTDVYVGPDVDQLRLAGRTTANRPSVDIASAITPGEVVSVVRLCDGPDRGSGVPGADIDAVAALSWIPQPSDPAADNN